MLWSKQPIISVTVRGVGVGAVVSCSPCSGSQRPSLARLPGLTAKGKEQRERTEGREREEREDERESWG